MSLSAFQQGLMELVVVGANDQKIASRLGISVEEVRLSVDLLLKELGLTERIELLFFACSVDQQSKAS